MNTTDKTQIYIVTSPPRSGTTTLTKMASICGLKTNHVLGNKKFHKLLKEGVTFFSDTPFYSPPFLIGVLESLNPDIHNVNFIHSCRDQEPWKESFIKLQNRWTPPDKKSIFNKKFKMLDCFSYERLNESSFTLEKHLEDIEIISSIYDLPLLRYSFLDGWGSFCEFINKNIPSCELPHLNKS